MKRSLFFWYLVFGVFLLPLQSKAQLPTCNGPGSGIIYFTHNDTIFNYNPSLPLSASNPSINSISLPAVSTGYLSVNENLNVASPSPTFYTVGVLGTIYYFYYYNGTSWVNTGNTYPLSGDAIGGGGGYLYVYSGVEVAQYNGLTNASLLAFGSFGTADGAIHGVAADCNGNFYIIDPHFSWMHKYSPSASLLQSWSLSGSDTSILNGGSSGFVIIGDNIYYHTYTNNNDSLWTGTINGSNVNISGTAFSHYIGAMATCPLGEHVAVTYPDTIYYCNGIADTLIGYGSGPLTWSVISGPAVINGSGDTVTVTTSATSSLLLSSGAFMYCGANTDTVVIIDTSINLTLSSNSPVCNGDSLHLSVSNPLSTSTYIWTGPANYTDSVANAFLFPTALADSGYYTLKETFHNCTTKDSIMVHVKPLPFFPIATSNSPLCAGANLQLTINNSQSGVTYNWSGANSFSSNLQNPVRNTVPLIDSGKYRVKAILNGCGSAYDTIDVVINPVIVPTVNITSVPLAIPAGYTDTFTAHANIGCNNPTYQWYINGVKINGATTNPYHAALLSGDHISVTVHCAGCANPDSATSNQLTTTGVVSWQSAIGNVKVWPNPITDELHIEILGRMANKDITIKIYDIVGRVIYTSSSAAADRREASISTHNFSKGTYILELISSDGGREIRKIVK